MDVKLNIIILMNFQYNRFCAVQKMIQNTRVMEVNDRSKLINTCTVSILHEVHAVYYAGC